MPLHPFLETMLANQRAAGVPALSAGTPADARALLAAGRAALGPGPDMAASRAVEVPTRSGSVPARLLVPHGTVSGIVVYLHGGGWVIGEAADYEILGRVLADRSHCSVLLPDYRLAPEHPFPAGLEDTEDVLTWVTAHGADLAGEAVPLVVAGDSAGANLATVALRRLGDRVDAALQVLAYPVTDTALDTASYAECAEGFGLSARDMAWFVGHYGPESIRSSPDVAPLRATDLAGLPPAVVVTAEYDVLRSEGEAYVDALAAAGVPVTHRRLAGATHGFLRLHNHIAEADAAVGEVAAAIADAVKNH